MFVCVIGVCGLYGGRNGAGGVADAEAAAGCS